MIIIPAIQVEDESTPDALAELILAESNIPEPDPDDPEEASATMWSAGSYDLDDRVIEDHMLYISVTNSNNDQPSVGVNKSPQTWVLIGPSNQWRALMLTTSVDVRSAYEGLVKYTFQVNTIIDRLALFNVRGESVNVKFYGPNDTLVYDETATTASLDGIDDPYDWCFKPPQRSTKFSGFEIPVYDTGTLEVNIIGDYYERVGVGKIVFGYGEDFGTTLSPVRSSSIDLGRTRRNDYGNTILSPGRVIFKKDFDCIVDSARAAELEEMVKSFRGLPVGIIGEPDEPFTQIYGRVLDYSITFNSYPKSQTTLNTEEL